MSNVYQFSDYKEPVLQCSPVESLEAIRDELRVLYNILQFMHNVSTPLAELSQKIDLVEKCHIAVKPETLASLQWIAGELAKIEQRAAQQHERLDKMVAEMTNKVNICN